MRKLFLAAPLLVAACATAPAPSGVCHNEKLGSFVGREANQKTLAELQRAAGAKTMRVVQPGMMITMEFSSQRVTVQLAPGNRIERANCG